MRLLSSSHTLPHPCLITNGWRLDRQKVQNALSCTMDAAVEVDGGMDGKRDGLSEPTEVAHQQILYLYDMAKKELDARREENRKHKILIANLQATVAEHEKAWDIREGELREQHIRETRRLKKGLEQHMQENSRLTASVKEKDTLLSKYLSENNMLKNKNNKLESEASKSSSEHNKYISKLRKGQEEEIRNIKIELARAVKIKIDALMVKHKQELFVAGKHT
eukprot:g6706.t1